MKGKTVLLVEDDFLNRRVAKKTLAENGYDVFEAKNAKEALEVLATQKVDLAILDINLGEAETDGILLGQIIKDKYNVPFIYLTAYENYEIIDRAVITSPYSYLTKPFKNVDLITAVGLAIRQAGLNENKPQSQTIIVKDKDYNVELLTDEINYVESKGNYVAFHTNHKVYTLRSTIRNVLELLPASSFIQVHRAYVVNKSKIEKYNSKNLVIQNLLIPVSKIYFDKMNGG